jgi:hypothetical protein
MSAAARFARIFSMRTVYLRTSASIFALSMTSG